MKDNFVWNLDSDKVLDSMCYDSGEVICSYGTEDNYIQIVVRGFVKVFYKDGDYRHFSDMPEDLQKLFLEGKYYKLAEVAETWENNWHEVEYIKDGVYEDGDVAEFGTPATKEEMEGICKEYLEYYRKEAA
jgi:hypothetical protein